MKKRYSNFDMLRLGMCFLVTVLHLRPFSDYCKVMDFWLTSVITRVAVPVFFSVSGFLFQEGKRDYKKYVTRMIILYVGWTILYMPQIFISFYSDKYAPYGLAMKVIIFIRRFFLVSSWTQLWYFLASAYAMIVILWLSKIIELKRIFLFGTILSFISACIEDCYIWIIARFIPGSDTIFSFFSRMKPFIGTISGCVAVAIMYISLGMMIAENREKLVAWGVKSKLGCKKLFLLMAFCLGLLTAEVITDYLLGAKETSRMVSLLPLVFLTIVYSISTKQIDISFAFSKTIRAVTILVYGFSGIVSFYFPKSEMGVKSFIYYILIVSISLFLSWISLQLNKTKAHNFIRALF